MHPFAREEGRPTRLSLLTGMPRRHLAHMDAIGGRSEITKPWRFSVPAPLLVYSYEHKELVRTWW